MVLYGTCKSLGHVRHIANSCLESKRAWLFSACATFSENRTGYAGGDNEDEDVINTTATSTECALALSIE